MTLPVGLYVHIPWCVRKCPYCDFNSHPARGEVPVAVYTDALLADLAEQLSARSGTVIGTVFFGGGTPSLFPPAAFGRLLDYLEPWLARDAEITMEANPGTTEHGDLTGYRSAGINRLSFGAQSFSEAHLAALGRIHDREAIYRSFELARSAGFDNVNLDLMYGLPRQTRAEAMADLDAAIALAPEHLSWYQLTLEPKTEFARRPPPLPSDIMLAAIEDAGYARLERAGFTRYEVSAFAREDRQSRHNLGYWNFADYLGAGAGAHGKLTDEARTHIRRTQKPHQPRLYMAQPESTAVTPVAAESLPGEFMLNALRLVAGVAPDRFEAMTGLPLAVLEPTRSRQIEAGLLDRDRLAATPRGFALLDSLIQAYL